MMEARLYLAEVMTTTSERELLESMDKKELSELMDRAHKIHGRLGHPSKRLLVRNLKVREGGPKARGGGHSVDL